MSKESLAAVFRQTRLWQTAPLILFAVVFPFLAGWIPIARFTHEQIDIDVYLNHVVMKGYYYYRNPFPFSITQGLSIPLPVDANHPSPVDLSAEQLTPDKREIPIRYFWGVHRLEVRLAAYEEICVKVQYYQYASEQNARYILKTTQPWHQPLTYGTYRLIPHNVQIKFSNYPIKSLESDAQGFIKDNFMPQEDWTFSWESQ